MRRLIVGSVLSAVLLLGACTDKEEDAVELEKPEEQVEQPEIEEVETEVVEEPEAVVDGEILNPYIAEKTGGDVEVVFTNSSPGLKHTYGDDVTIEIEQYEVVHVTNMNESGKTEFQGEAEGYVLTYKMKLDNQMDEDVFFNASTMMKSEDATENLYMKAHFVNRDDWMKDESTGEVMQYSKGKSFSGMQAYAMTKAQFERIKAPTLTISEPFLEGDPGKMFGEKAVFKLPFTELETEKAVASSELYPDKMVTDNVADKEVFFSKEDINESKAIEGVNVTLDGVQYANVMPTTGHADRFSNFGDGPLVAITAKFTVENASDEAFSKFLIEKKLILDQNRGTLRSEGMLEPSAQGDLNPGESDEVIAVFLFREDEFNLLKELDLQFGPLADENAKKLYKEKSVTFKLPMK